MNKIVFAKPDVNAGEARAARLVLESGWLTTGPRVAEFEKKIAERCGAEAVVAVDSCTTALELSLRALGIGPGDEVITTPMSYTATADVIYAVGAKIVFADLGEDTFEMDYEDVVNKITPNTKAVIAVDYGGKVCDYQKLFIAARQNKHIFRAKNEVQEKLGRIAVIADAAHSFGASRDGHVSGTCADITCFSFHVLKNITTGGEGGAICLSPWLKDLENTLRGMRHHFQTGKDPANGWEYDIEDMGFNRPMTDIEAAIGLSQLIRLDFINIKRHFVTLTYNDHFAGDKQIRPLIDHFEKYAESAYHLYPVSVCSPEGNDSEEFRNKVILRMLEKGIPCNVHYKPMPMFTAYKKLGYRIEDYPNAYNRYKNLITLPYHTFLTGEQIEYIADNLKRAVRI